MFLPSLGKKAPINCHVFSDPGQAAGVSGKINLSVGFLNPSFNIPEHTTTTNTLSRNISKIIREDSTLLDELYESHIFQQYRWNLASQQ